MVNKLSQNKSFLLTLLLFIFAFPIAIEAQAPTPTPREALIQAVQARAARDVEIGRSPESITDLEILFGDAARDAGVSMPDLLVIYEDAYAAAQTPQPWYADLVPNIGWVVAIIMLILLAIGDKFKEYLSQLVGKVAEKAYMRLAGHRPFWRFALKRYREKLVANYKVLKIPFQTDIQMEMAEAYVPLKVNGESDSDLIDAYAMVAQKRKLMIVGEPGSGKSMLLRQITLLYAQQGLTDQPIPVLLELHRLNEAYQGLENSLVDVLKRYEFPNAGHFVQAHLKQGQLLLLLDGLDEVNPDQRPKVVQSIKDLTEKFPDCHVVITCRTAVYRQELNSWSDQNLELAFFTDQQIQRFMYPWQKDMPPDKSTTHLLHTLRERPNIFKLAQNPLLLTIIAFLYTYTDSFVIPHSRVAFYRDAVSKLLEKWKGERNSYTQVEKETILRHLALYNQERPKGSQQDRRSMTYSDVLAQIQLVLPSLNRKHEEAKQILDEIVERSGLLLKIDGGYHYQFAHLTLQEYFAALALEYETDKLISLYRQEPDVWRETVKLWCGLPHDSTQLLQEIYDIDSIMVFECLGDVHQANIDFTTAVIAEFKELLGHSSEHAEAIIRAFGVVAASQQRERGKEVFAFLQATLENKHEQPARRFAAAQALAWTNLPQATGLLAQYAPQQKEIHSLLVSMGDLAVPILQELTSSSEKWVQDGLAQIGTPAAALALAPLLWSDDALQKHNAAWQLGSLFANAGVEEALQQFPLTTNQRNSDHFDWIWEPFQTEKNNPVRIIAGRTAFILDQASDKLSPPELKGKLDQRLAIPLTMIVGQSSRSLKNIRAGEERDQFFKAIDSKLEQSQPEIFVEVLDEVCKDKNWQSWFHNLPQAIHKDVLKRLVANDVKATSNDWRNVYRPSSYKFDQSWQEKGIRLAFVLLILLGVANLIIEMGIQGTFGQWVHYILPAILLATVFILARSRLTLDNILVFISLVGFSLGVAITLGLASTDGRIYVYVILFAVMGFIGGFLIDESINVIIAGAILGAIIGAGIGAVALWILDMFTVSLIVKVIIIGAIIGALTGLLFGILDGIGSALLGLIVGAIYGGIVLVLPMLFALPPTQLLLRYGGVTAVFLFWPLWITWISMLYRQGKRQERLAQNPLQGLLEGDSRFYQWRSRPVSSIGRLLARARR